jgi:hypothetical protein
MMNIYIFGLNLAAGNACEMDFQVNSLVPVDGAGGPLDASDAFL